MSKWHFDEFHRGTMNMTAKNARGERLQLMLSPDELTALDDFRFKTRMPSRAAAVRELLRRGLAAEGHETAVFGQKSEDFGVTDGPLSGNGHDSGSEPSGNEESA